MTISDRFELANDAEFRLLANFTTPPRAGRITVLEPSGQVRVATDDPNGGDVLAWPLNGFRYAVDDVVYLAFAANSPDTAIVIGAKAPLPTLDAGVLPEAYVAVDGSDALTADWDIGADRRIKTEAIRARDGEGLRLEDDAGALGLFVEDGGRIGVNQPNPGAAFEVQGSATSTEFIAVFAENGVAPEGSAVLTTNADKAVTVQGDGGAYFVARDIANNIEYINGTSSVGAGFTGTMTPHDLQLRTGNATRMTVQESTGNIGFGTTLPQGRLHAHDGTGGLLFVSKTGITNSTQTLIPNGAGDVTGGITGFFVANDGSGAVANSFTLLPGEFVDVVVGGYTLRLALNVNGALTAVRQSGVGTATLTILAIWQ